MSLVAEADCGHIGTLNKAIIFPDICMKRHHKERWGQIRDELAAVNRHVRHIHINNSCRKRSLANTGVISISCHQPHGRLPSHEFTVTSHFSANMFLAEVEESQSIAMRFSDEPTTDEGPSVAQRGQGHRGEEGGQQWGSSSLPPWSCPVRS